MNWEPYNDDLDKLFNATSFDTLTKMGYDIWGRANVDEDTGEVDYETVLQMIHDEWNELEPQAKADAFMDLLQVSARGLIGILGSGNYDCVQ